MYELCYERNPVNSATVTKTIANVRFSKKKWKNHFYQSCFVKFLILLGVFSNQTHANFGH